MTGKSKHIRVLFLGGESSGKSTITKKAAELYDATYTPEYGRIFYEETPKEYEYSDLATIGLQQMRIEEQVLIESTAPVSFYDTSLLVTYFYSMEWFGRADPGLKLYTPLMLSSYDLIYLCQNDFPFVQDGTRQSEAFSKKQHDFYEFVLQKFGISFVKLFGSVTERLNTIQHNIGELYGIFPERKIEDLV